MVGGGVVNHGLRRLGSCITVGLWVSGMMLWATYLMAYGVCELDLSKAIDRLRIKEDMLMRDSFAETDMMYSVFERLHVVEERVRRAEHSLIPLVVKCEGEALSHLLQRRIHPSFLPFVVAGEGETEEECLERVRAADPLHQLLNGSVFEGSSRGKPVYSHDKAISSAILQLLTDEHPYIAVVEDDSLFLAPDALEFLYGAVVNGLLEPGKEHECASLGEVVSLEALKQDDCTAKMAKCKAVATSPKVYLVGAHVMKGADFHLSQQRHCVAPLVPRVAASPVEMKCPVHFSGMAWEGCESD
eukprot:Sspe_Gene.105643::Locus_82693_Transcript_1_1_Confidence_1.000_Length_1014::g.105643::m.105643